MALYNETDDWQRFAREQMQNSAQNLQQKQAGLDAANNQKTKTTLESALSGLVNGLKERGSDILNTVKNIEKTKYGWLKQIGANKSIENAQKDDSARRNEIAKKYGFNSYSEAINSNKVGDDFWNEIKANNEQTKQNLKAKTDAYRNNFTDVTKVNTNEAKGQALNTIDSVLSLIPGAGGVVANVAGGAIAGVGDEYKRVGREGGDFNLDNALKNAAVGGASGLAGSAGSAGLGKVATKFGGNAVGKALSSNLASGVAGGASAGAVGGALGTALNGGTLEDALLAAKEGAKAGGIGGGVMAGTMGLGGTALEKLRNRGATAQAIEPVDAQIVQKNRIEAPTAERIPSTVEAVEPVSNKRGIAITDLDAGEQTIPVRSASNESRGRFIDSVVDRAKANLPEAKMPSTEQRFKNNFDKTLEDLIYGGDMGNNFKDIVNNLKVNGITADDIARLKSETGSYAADNNPLPEITKGGLPKLSLDDYMKVKGYTRREDIPQEMLQFLRKDGRRFEIPDMSWGEMFPERTQGAGNGSVDITPDDIIDYYENVAVTPSQRAIYTPENVAGALYTNPELNTRFQTALLEQYNPARKINIESALAQAQPVDITDLTTNYRRSTIPARQYEQAVKTMPEAEIVTNRPTTAQITPEAEVSATATGWGDKNMTNASKKRNILQRAGETLQETGQATKDSQVYSKLKGNTAEEMARKNSVQRLRDLGFNSTDYDRAANLSEVINKYYDDAVKATKTPIEAPQLRNIANEIADDLRISAENRADLIKNLNSMLDDAVARDGKMSEYTMDRYTPADLEKVAKKLGVMEQNLITTNQGGSKKKIRNLRPEVEEYARALGEARNRLRNEIGEMADYDGKELAARMKDAGATQKQIDYVTKGGTLRSAKAATSLFEDARTMADQIKADAYKRGANATNSTNFVTQVANASGASNLVNMAARPVANVFGTIEKGAGKVISGIGNKLAGTAGDNAGETAGRLANGAKNIVSGAADLANRATASLNNDYLAGINDIRTRNGNTVEFNALGNQAQQFANKQMGKAEAERSQNRLENAQAVANAQNDYDNALADYNAQEANFNANMAQAQNQATGASQLDRIAAAMEMALNAGDITAYGQLADLYTQAAKIEELRNPAGTASGLNATQQKELNRMDTAANAIDELEKLYTNAGGGQGIVGGNIANLLGNVGINSDVASYNALSEGLINQIAAAVGKTDALNNEAEVKRALSLVPKITDTPQTAQTKLNTLREMLQTNRETMLTNYGA